MRKTAKAKQLLSKRRESGADAHGPSHAPDVSAEKEDEENEKEAKAAKPRTKRKSKGGASPGRGASTVTETRAGGPAGRGDEGSIPSSSAVEERADRLSTRQLTRRRRPGRVSEIESGLEAECHPAVDGARPGPSVELEGTCISKV